MNLELQTALIYFPGLEAEHRDAVRMMCHFYEVYPKIFQNRSFPYKIPSAGKDPRRLYLFKCCLQAIKELKEKNGPEPIVWLIAQLKILRLMDYEDGVFLGKIGNSLYGEKAWSRWKLFESHTKKQLNRISVSKPVKVKNIIESMKSTHDFISKNNLDDLLLDGKIRMLCRNNKISKNYLILHPKIVEFAKKYTWNSIGIDPNTVTGADNKEILEFFEKITGIKPVGPSIS